MEWKDILHHNELVSINFLRLLSLFSSAMQKLRRKTRNFISTYCMKKIVPIESLISPLLLSPHRSTFNFFLFFINFINFFNNFFMILFLRLLFKEEDDLYFLISCKMALHVVFTSLIHSRIHWSEYV